MMLRKMTVCAAALMLVWGTSVAQAQEQALTNGVLVKLRAEPSVKVLSNADHARTLSAAVKKTLKVSNGPAPDMRLVHGDGSLSDEELAEALRQAPNVELAAPNRAKYLQAVPNDPYFPRQWHLQANDYAATRAQGAWDITTGSPSVPVAVLDTGVRPEHPDLAPNLLPGYDFVVVNPLDGDGFDPDPTDPGDYVPQCPKANQNSWHGTKVSGLIAAAGNNSQGVAGLNWNGRIVPVRVLGACGTEGNVSGYDLEILGAMRWAAGLDSFDGVPDNPNPVRVLNASLGGMGACQEIPGSPYSSPLYPVVMRDLAAKGAMLVAAAGNDALPVGLFEPANCPGVIAVAAVTADGYKTEYSNFGPEVFISAPGGSCNDRLCKSLATTSNAGTYVPAENGYDWAGEGTSFSAPLVSGAIALMLSANPNLSPADVKTILKETARPFPRNPALPMCNDVPFGVKAECNCTTSTCGAGILDVEAAVRRAKERATPQPQPAPQPQPQPQPEPESSGGGGAADWLALFGLLGLAAGRRRARKA